MQNLADVVLDYFWLLLFADDKCLNDDDALKLTESLMCQIEEFSEDEKRALSEAAVRRLQWWLREPDEDGYTPRERLSPEQKIALEDIANGRFDLSSLNGVED